jgi:hypothetical protein
MEFQQLFFEDLQAFCLTSRVTPFTIHTLTLSVCQSLISHGDLYVAKVVNSLFSRHFPLFLSIYQFDRIKHYSKVK